MVKNRATKAVARFIKSGSSKTYPRALAEAMSTDAAVSFHSKNSPEEFGFSLEQDRNLIVTGPPADRSTTFGNTVNRFRGTPVTVVIIDHTREHIDFYEPQIGGVGSSQGWSTTPEEALETLTKIAVLMDDAVRECKEHGVDVVEQLPGFSSGDRIVVAITDLPDLVAASPGCAQVLAQITAKLDGNRVHLMVCGDDISVTLVPGAKRLTSASRLHFGNLDDAIGIPSRKKNAWASHRYSDDVNVYHEKANGALQPIVMQHVHEKATDV